MRGRRGLPPLLTGGLLAGGLLLAACGSPGGQTLSWQEQSATGRTVVLRYLATGCQTGTQASVHETSTAVRIELRTRPATGACPHWARQADLPVQLARPLGDRALTGQDG